MTVRQFIWKCVRRVLNWPMVNSASLPVIRLMVPILSDRILYSLPVHRSVCIPLPRAGTLRMLTKQGDPIARHLFWRGIDGFEGSTLRVFLALIQHAGTVLDIGANTGLYSLMAGADDPNRVVYGFEPLPELCRHFQANIDLSQLTAVRAEPAAVTNYDGQIELYVPSCAFPSSSSTKKGFREAARVVSVPAVTLDTFAAGHDISRVDLIKIDTEATEPAVLQGAAQTIRKDRPLIICEVLKGRTEEGLHAELDQHGYRYFWITDAGLVEKERIVGDPTYVHDNYLFLPQEKVGEVLDLLGSADVFTSENTCSP